MRLVAVVGFGLGLALSPAAEAAQRVRSQAAIEPPMQVYLVRSAEAGCEPKCPEWIAAQGRIEAGSVARFRRTLRQLKGRKVPVLIDSGGGRVHEALAIGRLIRANGLDVVVSRTALTSCATADAACRRQTKTATTARSGLPKAEESKCASSCAFVLAAGARRLVGPSAFVGVHQVRSFYIYAKIKRTYRVTPTGRQVVSERRVTERVVETRTPPGTYTQIRRYFAKMGIDSSIMPLILSTPGDRLHWLTRGELQATGLATDWIDGEQLLTRVAVPAPLQAIIAPAAEVGVAGTMAADDPGAVPVASPK
jgi:hypothetical protein